MNDQEIATDSRLAVD